MKYTLSWVHPRKIITGFRKVFNGVCIKKPTLRNFYLMLQAVCVAPSFRIQSIASHLPIRVKHDKSKQKRVLRFIDTYFPVAAVKGAWLVTYSCQCVSFCGDAASACADRRDRFTGRMEGDCCSPSVSQSCDPALLGSV